MKFILCDVTVLIDLGIVFGLVAAVAITLDVDDLPDAPPLLRARNGDDEIDSFTDHLLHRLLPRFRRQLF